VPRSEYSGCVARDEGVVVRADAALHARGGSHDIWKVVGRSSVLCAWFSSSRMEETAGLSYETRMQSRYLGNDLIRIRLCFIGPRKIGYLVGYRSRSAKHPRSGRRHWHSWLQSRHTCADTWAEEQGLPASYATLAYTAPWSRGRLHTCNQYQAKNKEHANGQLGDALVLWRSLGMRIPRSLLGR